MTSSPESATAPRLDLTDQELSYRLGWFIRLRWLAALGCLGMILLTRYVLRIHIPLPKLVGGILFLLLYNAFCTLVSKVMHLSQSSSRRHIILFANAQIALDLIGLTLLLHFAGGVENFFFVFYVFHMVIASELLSSRNAVLQATLAAVLFNAVAWLEALDVIPHVHLERIVPPNLYRDEFFVLEVCCVLTATLYITVYLASSISSRLRQREHEIEDANENLRSLDRQKSFFMRKVSHELRSPLGAVQSLLKVILAGHRGPLAPEQARLIERADIRAGELIVLLDELLRYSRLRSAVRLESREPIALCGLTRKITDLFAPMCEEKKIELHTELNHALVEGDEEALEELVTNLVSNAVRYTPEGGTISVRTKRDGGRAELEVKDSGIGIEPNELPYVFEEFHRSPRAKKFARSGTGLGLAIVRRVTEMHGGQMGVQSTLGEGTTFTATLPALEPADGSPGRQTTTD